MSKKNLNIDWILLFSIFCPGTITDIIIIIVAIYYWWVILIITAISFTCYFLIKKKKQSLTRKVIRDCQRPVPNVGKLEYIGYVNSLKGLVLKTQDDACSFCIIEFSENGDFRCHDNHTGHLCFFDLEYIKSFRIYEYDAWKRQVCIEVINKCWWRDKEEKAEIVFEKKYLENAVKFYKILQKSSILKVKYLKQKKIEEEKKIQQEKIRIQQEILELTETLNSLNSFAIEKKNIEIKRNRIENFPEIKITKINEKFKKNEMLAYVVLQIKTTGESVSRNGKITEIAALKYVEGMLYEKFIAKISDEKQVDTYTVDEIRQPLLEFIGKCNIISYDIKYCLKFLYVFGLDEIFAKKRKFFSVDSYLGLKDENNSDLFSVCKDRKIYFDKNSLICSCYAIDKLLEYAVNRNH